MLGLSSQKKQQLAKSIANTVIDLSKKRALPESSASAEQSQKEETKSILAQLAEPDQEKPAQDKPAQSARVSKKRAMGDLGNLNAKSAADARKSMRHLPSDRVLKKVGREPDDEQNALRLALVGKVQHLIN